MESWSNSAPETRAQGFTLVEVMVALVIIAVAMVTLLSTHARSTRSYAEAKTTLICTLLAQQKLAELQMNDFPEAGDQSGAFEENEHYLWAAAVRNTDLEALREITVEVSPAPPEGGGEAPAFGGVTVSGYVADLGKKEEGEEEEH